MIVAASFDINQPELWLNRALQYGDGLFETMRCHDSIIPLWSFHQQRLSQGLQRLNLQEPDWLLIEQNVKKQSDKEQCKSIVYKLTVFRAGEERGYQASTQKVEWILSKHSFDPENSTQLLKLGVSNIRLALQPLLAGLKHLSRLEQVLIANQLAAQTHMDDLLVLDAKGRVIETTCQNLVIIKDNQLLTPKLDHAGVQGVALKWLESQFEVVSKHLMLKDIEACDALMVCNALRGFRLVATLLTDKHSQSFLTKHPVHDKISTQWQLIFNS